MRTRIAPTLAWLGVLATAACATPAPATSAAKASPVERTPSASATRTEDAPPRDADAARAAPPPSPSANADATAEPRPPVTAPAPPRFTITKGTRVLMFGDSMVTSGLGVYLQERIVARGGKLFLISKGSSTSATWGDGREVPELIARLRPDIVLVVLASNELFVPNPEARRYAVRSVVDRIGARPCLWIGPAPWLPEKGIIGVVRSASPPCRFFDSSPLVLERQADHIHPTLLGGKVWADAVWQDAFAD